jgi:aldose 1-epimerase
MNPSVSHYPFGTTRGGEKIERWRLDNGAGITADILSYGAILHRLGAANVPVTVSRADFPYYGAVVGRYANRIAGGRFVLDGTTWVLPVNDRGNTLHGGPRGFSDRIWSGEALLGRQDPAVRLTLVSPHLEMGFPGTLQASVTYCLDRTGTLAIDYRAVTDQATVVNMSNHAYFNLAGKGSVLGHVLQIEADTYLPVSATGIPVGSPIPVAGTPFDFQEPIAISERMSTSDSQVRRAGGYDHCFVLRPDGRLRKAALLRDPAGDRALEVWTTEPGLQVYTGNKLKGTDRHSAICLETQHFPNSPNMPSYPATVLRPGDQYRSRTELRLLFSSP